MNKVQNTLFAVGGVTGIEAMPSLVNEIIPQEHNVIGLAMQIIIGLITIFKLVRKNKNINN